MSTITEIAFEEPVTPDEHDAPPGVGVYALAWRRLRRNRVAMFFGFIFLLIVVMCLLAPVYASSVAHIGPDTIVTGPINLGHGKILYAINTVGVPIGPTWNISHFFLGADELGRDIGVRLLYGGRNSIEIGTVAMLITMVFGTMLGTIAGYFRGWLDQLISRVMDVIWAYPAVLLGITLGTVINIRGFLFLHSTTLMTTAFVVGFVYIPYIVRPIRAQVLGLREREFVDAARQQGLSSFRIMFGELLPNLASTIVVFVPLMLANAIILEAALDFLGAGVQPPTPAWGNMIQEGLQEFPGAFHAVVIPGLALVLTVMSVNIFGDGVRDALDPRAKAAVRQAKS
jgi:peptide/nickel transport system permease protein